MPDCVREATEDYRRSSDKLLRFMEEEMQPDSNAETPTRMVYARYQDWCESNGHRAESMVNFRKALLEGGVEICRKRPRGSTRKNNAINLLIGFRFSA